MSLAIRRKVKVQPLQMQSPQDDLCELSFLGDTFQSPLPEYRLPPKEPSKLSHLEGWNHSTDLSPVRSSPSYAKNHQFPYMMTKKGMESNTELRNIRQFSSARQSSSKQSLHKTESLEMSKRRVFRQKVIILHNLSQTAYPELRMHQRRISVPHKKVMVELVVVNYPIVEQRAKSNKNRFKMNSHVSRLRKLLHSKDKEKQ